MTRRIAGVALLAAGVLAGIDGGTLGLAQWLVFSADVPGVTASGPAETLARAASLSPSDGPLSLWSAQQARRDLLTGWLSRDSLDLAETALTRARTSVSNHPGNPYAEVALARVLLDRVRHPRTPQDLRDPALHEATERLERALRTYPTSADVGHQVASALIDAWRGLDDASRRVAIRGVARVGEHDRLRFPDLLRRLSTTVIEERPRSTDFLESLVAATPPAPWAQAALAGFLQELARSSDLRHTGASERELHEAAAEAGSEAARLFAYYPDWTRRWLEAADRGFPEGAEDRLAETRQATVAHPENAGAWLALAWSARSAGYPSESEAAAARAGQLARALVDAGRDTDPGQLQLAERVLRALDGLESTGGNRRR